MEAGGGGFEDALRCAAILHHVPGGVWPVRDVDLHAFPTDTTPSVASTNKRRFEAVDNNALVRLGKRTRIGARMGPSTCSSAATSPAVAPDGGRSQENGSGEHLHFMRPMHGVATVGNHA